jgi:hypothetical protein
LNCGCFIEASHAAGDFSFLRVCRNGLFDGRNARIVAWPVSLKFLFSLLFTQWKKMVMIRALIGVAGR